MKRSWHAAVHLDSAVSGLAWQIARSGTVKPNARRFPEVSMLFRALPRLAIFSLWADHGPLQDGSIAGLPEHG